MKYSSISEGPSLKKTLSILCFYLLKLSLCCCLNDEGFSGGIDCTKTQKTRKLLQETLFHPFSPPTLESPIGFDAPSPSPYDDVISPSPAEIPISPSAASGPSPAPELPLATPRRSRKRRRLGLIVTSSAIAGPVFLLLAAFAFYFVKSGKILTVKPWKTGLSGQLQKAFVAGVPKLRRAELQAACEDFSNVIGSLRFCTMYKGTLSSGVEIAVASVLGASGKDDWSNVLEAQFRKKIEALSKVNHKNFVSVLGYCEEDEPFTRMIVFEYAPNGTLFEHLHVKESEHLDWATRMRIAMGVIYCLDHMHHLSPPSPHNDLNSSSVYLTEDYAAKISNFAFSDELSSSPYAEVELNLKNDVYNFGTLLFEMVTGKILHSSRDWLLDYIDGEKPLRELVDPTLEDYRGDQLREIDDVIKSCCDEDWRRRPSAKEVCERLKEATGIGPHEAIPNRSPLWWAELEILSAEGAA